MPTIGVIAELSNTRIVFLKEFRQALAEDSYTSGLTLMIVHADVDIPLVSPLLEMHWRCAPVFDLANATSSFWKTASFAATSVTYGQDSTSISRLC